MPGRGIKKNDSEAAAFPDRLKRFMDLVIAFAGERRVRLFMEDEARFGLHESVTRRCITAPGIKPHQLVLPRYEYFWIYGAAEPATGESFFLEMPALDSICFQVFLDEFSRAYPTTLNVLVLDGAPAHIAHALRIPENVVLFRLPPYCPELNSIERLWQDFRKRLGVDLPAGLRSLADDVARVVCEYTPQVIASITGYPYLRRASAQTI
ncbi:MAG TPA: IS630 family transposase [Longimicrobium sp.]|nr:IS630 family transposase [Longimicrobium sp.]